MSLHPVPTRGTCSPDIAMLANELLEVVQELLARPVLMGDHGLPSDTVGRDGDFYIDFDSGNVYVKEGGTWGS